MSSANLQKALLILPCALLLQACHLGQRDDLLILVRADDAMSKATGKTYAQAYNVPAHRILNLSLSRQDLPDVIDAATYESEIANPIKSYLTAKDPDQKISMLLTTVGIPLRMTPCKNESSHRRHGCSSVAIDAALAGLGRLDFTEGRTKEDNEQASFGRNSNPYFGDRRSFEDFRRDEPNANLRFLVARLPKPPKSPENDSTLRARLGRLIDRQEPIPSNTPAAWKLIAHAPRDSRDAVSHALFEPIHDLLSRTGSGICDGCVDPPEAPAPNGVILQRRAAVRGVDSLPERFNFPGLIIDLSSHETDLLPFQETLQQWISRGALAISIHLDDPTLFSITRPAMQLRAWIEGRMAVEAHFISLPQLGGTNVFIGDPLLRTKHPTTLESGDFDFDGIPDDQDNCVWLANPAQRDSNSDGLGNRCDPDVDNDGRVDSSSGKIYPRDQRGDLEIIALTARNGPFDPDHDLDGDGRVGGRDLALAQLWLFRRPGPSGIR
jgi:hypothetical protein